MCQSKWELIKNPEEYDVKPIIKCDTCSCLIFPHFVHNSINKDYTCDRCGEDGDVMYFCMKCRRKRMIKI